MIKMIFKKENLSSAFDFLLVGLGNPGSKYENTRHNAGFMAMDKLGEKHKFKINKLKFKSLLGETTIEGKRCLVMKPQTFMNNSGESVNECASFYKIPVENIIVVFDDISLDVGSLRVRRKGSDGGHNGIKSIVYLLSSDQFPRVKIGVGKKPHPDYDLAAWVLSSFQQSDMKPLLEAIDNAVDAVELIVSGDTDKAMNKYN